MIPRSFLVGGSALLLLLLGLLATACGGGEKLTPEEYFARFEAINVRVSEQIDAMFADLPDANDEEFFRDEANLPVFTGLTNAFIDVLRVGLEAHDALSPPPEITEADQEFIDAGDELLDVFEGIAEELESAESIADAMQIRMASEQATAEAAARFEAACADLAEIAAASGVLTEVACREAA